MKTLKTIDKLCQQIDPENCYARQITFRHAAAGVKQRRKGYAIMIKLQTPYSPNHEREILTFEPCDYPKYKWMVYGFWLRYSGGSLRHCRSIQEAAKYGYKVLTDQKLEEEREQA